MPKILPGEIFLVLYKDGALVNRWAQNTGKTAVEFASTHKVAQGFTDIYIEDASGQVAFTSNRGNIADFDSITQLKFIKDIPFRIQAFGGSNLKVLKVANASSLYNTSGALIGSIPAGSEIGIVDGDAGNSSKHLLAVTAYNNPADGLGWRYVNQTTYAKGFMNIQQGFGLKLYNSTRAIATPFSEIENVINWSDVASVQVGKEALKEAYLRAIPALDTKEQVEESANDYFGAKDLKVETLGDPEQYFSNSKNFEFILRSLQDASLTGTATLFADEREYFINR